MKLDTMVLGRPLPDVAASAADAEARGYDGWFVAETAHDPLLSCAAAAQATDRVRIGTAIATAFPRSPMHVAYAAHDLQALSRGRFVLGLGSQIKTHVEKRFSATWSRPAARMREYILALRAIWAAWQTGEPLRFRGEFYRHTLMTPFFTPPDHGFGPPPVWLAAVGPRMTEVAGEVADGLICHSFTTERYLREVTLPHLQRGAERGGRDLDDLEVTLGTFLVTGRDDAEVAAAAATARRRIAFYGSTPAYRRVLDLHGWGQLHDALHERSLRGEWDEMADLIDDEVLDAFAIVAPPDEVGARVLARFGDVVDRIDLSTGTSFDEEPQDGLREQLRAGRRAG